MFLSFNKLIVRLKEKKKTKQPSLQLKITVYKLNSYIVIRCAVGWFLFGYTIFWVCVCVCLSPRLVISAAVLQGTKVLRLWNTLVQEASKQRDTHTHAHTYSKHTHTHHALQGWRIIKDQIESTVCTLAAVIIRLKRRTRVSVIGRFSDWN